jgi:hypothetical protein
MGALNFVLNRPEGSGGPGYAGLFLLGFYPMAHAFHNPPSGRAIAFASCVESFSGSGDGGRRRGYSAAGAGARPRPARSRSRRHGAGHHPNSVPLLEAAKGLPLFSLPWAKLWKSVVICRLLSGCTPLCGDYVFAFLVPSVVVFFGIGMMGCTFF